MTGHGAKNDGSISMAYRMLESTLEPVVEARV